MATRWTTHAHQRGASAGSQRIDGVLLRRDGITPDPTPPYPGAYRWRYVAVIAGQKIDLEAWLWEEAHEEVDARFPLPEWWTSFISSE